MSLLSTKIRDQAFSLGSRSCARTSCKVWISSKCFTESHHLSCRADAAGGTHGTCQSSQEQPSFPPHLFAIYLLTFQSTCFQAFTGQILCPEDWIKNTQVIILLLFHWIKSHKCKKNIWEESARPLLLLHSRNTKKQVQSQIYTVSVQPCLQL